MINVTLHPPARWRDVVLEQIRIVGLSLRPAALVVAAVLGIGTCMIVSEIVVGGSGFDSDEAFPTAVISFLFPFAVWRSENRFGPSFLWTLPMERRRLALARVFAGGVWLMVALAIFALWLLALVLIGGAPPAMILSRIPYITTFATYLLGSAFVLGLRHPLRWLLGTAGVFLLLGGVSQVLESFYGMETLLGSRDLYLATEHARAVWVRLPGITRWTISAFLSVGAGLIALCLALLRHREQRRP